ncbi:hypothetical protein BURMUCF2_A0884 [Burkholderia multivorans CF2]|nr:hypothetical protein BURMUCF2_A0884 [Burkholderia multivorans CF2]
MQLTRWPEANPPRFAARCYQKRLARGCRKRSRYPADALIFAATKARQCED